MAGDDIGFLHELFDQRLQLSGLVPRHGLAQVVDVAEGDDIGEGGDLVADGDEVGVQGIGQIALEPDVGHGGGGAIRAGEAAGLQMLIAVGVGGGGVGVIQRDAGDAGLFEGEEFAFIGNAVTVGILPDAQAGIGGVVGVDDAVQVGVELAQSGKAVGGFIAVGEGGVIAEELGTLIDGAIAIAVEDQQSIVLADPAGLLGEAVTVMVEEDAVGEGGGFDAVAVEVEDQGGGGGLGLVEMVFSAITNDLGVYGGEAHIQSWAI